MKKVKSKRDPAPASARKAAEKARKEALGLVRYPVWVPNTPEAKRAIRDFAASLVEGCN